MSVIHLINDPNWNALWCSSSGCSMMRSLKSLKVSTDLNLSFSSSAMLFITCWWLIQRWFVIWSSSSTTWSQHPWPRWFCPSLYSSGPCCLFLDPANASGWQPSSIQRCHICYIVSFNIHINTMILERLWRGRQCSTFFKHFLNFLSVYKLQLCSEL